LKVLDLVGWDSNWHITSFLLYFKNELFNQYLNLRGNFFIKRINKKTR